MKINVAKKKFLLCFRPEIIEPEPIELAGNNNNNNDNRQHSRRKVFLFQKTASTTHDHGRTHNKRSLSRIIKNVLLGNALTKRIRKRRRSTKTSDSPATKEPQQTTKSDKTTNQTFSATTEDAVFSLSPSTSLYSIQTQESNTHGGDGCCKAAAAAEEDRKFRWSSRGSTVTYYIKTTFRYVVYALLAVLGVAVFLRFNGVFLTCVWLYLAGGPVTPLFTGERQPTSRRRPYLVY